MPGVYAAAEIVPGVQDAASSSALVVPHGVPTTTTSRPVQTPDAWNNGRANGASGIADHRPLVTS